MENNAHLKGLVLKNANVSNTFLTERESTFYLQYENDINNKNCRNIRFSHVLYKQSLICKTKIYVAHLWCLKLISITCEKKSFE